MSKGTPGCWELPYLWSYFHLPAGPRERSEGMNDKLFQVSPGKQAGGGGVTGTVATTSPWKPDTRAFC